jgi:hypothetical protein
LAQTFPGVGAFFFFLVFNSLAGILNFFLDSVKLGLLFCVFVFSLLSFNSFYLLSLGRGRPCSIS